MGQAKPFDIPKALVWNAFKKVKENKGAAGIDHQSIPDFEIDLKNNLYKLWNRMCSGSYFPSEARCINIPKKGKGTRKLSIPTVTDRIAQMVVKLMLEPKIDSSFHSDSYGYRPNKSGLDAVATCRKRCWKYPWVLNLDIKAFFDNVNHELLMKAVKRHATEPWEILYIKRWLKMCGQNKGVPQGGVISPLLANLFLHYAFDRWIQESHKHNPFERYADDSVPRALKPRGFSARRIEDEGRPLEAGIQMQASNHLKLLWLRAMVVSVKEKAKLDFVRYVLRRRTQVNLYGGVESVGMTSKPRGCRWLGKNLGDSCLLPRWCPA